MNDNDEPLVDGLDHIPESVFEVDGAPDDLREALWHRTSRAVRARPRRRRVAVVCAVAVAYAAGVATMFLGAPSEPAPSVQVAVSTPKPAEEVTVKPGQPVLSVQTLSDPELLALRIARAPKEERARLLQEVGDHYLNNLGDIKLATRVYRQSIKLLSAEERSTFASTDTWLLASLKELSAKEENHANHTT